MYIVAPGSVLCEYCEWPAEPLFNSFCLKPPLKNIRNKERSASIMPQSPFLFLSLCRERISSVIYCFNCVSFSGKRGWKRESSSDVHVCIFWRTQQTCYSLSLCVILRGDCGAPVLPLLLLLLPSSLRPSPVSHQIRLFVIFFLLISK